MQCRIWFNKKAKNDKRQVLGPCVTNVLSSRYNEMIICLKYFQLFKSNPQTSSEQRFIRFGVVSKSPVDGGPPSEGKVFDVKSSVTVRLAEIVDLHLPRLFDPVLCGEYWTWKCSLKQVWSAALDFIAMVGLLLALEDCLTSLLNTAVPRKSVTLMALDDQTFCRILLLCNVWRWLKSWRHFDVRPTQALMRRWTRRRGVIEKRWSITEQQEFIFTTAPTKSLKKQPINSLVNFDLVRGPPLQIVLLMQYDWSNKPYYVTL